jgi:hypothetical protein
MNNIFNSIDDIEKVVSQFESSSKQILLFNRSNGAYISTLTNIDVSKLNSKYYKWKIVNFDSKTHTWDEGDYDNGKIIKLDDVKPLISESVVNTAVKESITSEYNSYKQNNIMMNMIKKIIEVDEFVKMHSYITSKREQNVKYKEAYKNSEDFNYLSNDDLFEKNVQMVRGDIANDFGIAVSRKEF